MAVAAQWKDNRESIMKYVAMVAVGILALGPLAAWAQEGGQSRAPDASRPAIGMGSKTMDSCRADTRTYCAQAPASLVKECLVKNWDHITSDCQDALGTPGRGAFGAAG